MPDNEAKPMTIAQIVEAVTHPPLPLESQRTTARLRAQRMQNSHFTW